MLLISSGVGHWGLPVLFGLKPDRLAHERSFLPTGVISTAFSSCSTSTTVPSFSPNFALNSLGMRTRPRSSMVDCMFPTYIVGKVFKHRDAFPSELITLIRGLEAHTPCTNY